MTNADITVILARLDELARRFDKSDADAAEIRRDVRELKSVAREIKTEVKRTNGRVTELEKVNEREAGREAARHEAEDDEQQRKEGWLNREWSLKVAVIGAALGGVLGCLGLIVAYIALEVIKTGHV